MRRGQRSAHRLIWGVVAIALAATVTLSLQERARTAQVLSAATAERR